MPADTLPYLIVEDIPDVADRLEHEMQQRGGWHCIGKAASVRDARNHLNQHRPALLFCDWDLVGGSGFEVLDYVHSLPGYQPFVVFNTGFQSDHPDIAEALINTYRPDVFINKPYWQKLREQLDHICLQAAQRARQAQRSHATLWLKTQAGPALALSPDSVMAVLQHAVHPRQKVVYTTQHLQGIDTTLTWTEAEQWLQQGGLPYFAVNKRHALVVRPHISAVQGNFVYLQPLPFKIEVVRENLRSFHDWLKES